MINRLPGRACCLFILTLFCIKSHAQLKADFSSNAISGCAPLLISFSDQSSGNPTEWKWDLGDGTISFLQNPSVSYFNPGPYTIKLVVKNANGADSVAKTQFINVSSKPAVQFVADITSGCYPLPVKFTDQTTAGSDSLVTWQWDFGDGFSSGEQHPTHIYASSGSYNVTLRVINNKGCLNTFSRSQYIQINAGTKAGFTNSTPNLCSAPVTINFQNSSTGTGSLSYQWSFGDGSISALQNPTHLYTSAGSYTVRLVVTNSLGCTDTITRVNAFTVGNVLPSFDAGNRACAGAPLRITNTSTPLPSSVTWNFGDGTTSTLINPTKTFTLPGAYQVKLVANFGACLDSVTQTLTVLAPPVADYIADDSTNCKFPFAVNFSNQSVNAASATWSFGDNGSAATLDASHSYNAYGNFAVKLVVTAPNGCVDSVVKTSYIRIVKPDVLLKNLPDSGCSPFTKSFSATVNSLDPVSAYTWSFGDGSTSTQANPSYSYSTPGIFPVSVVIITASGCSDTASMARAIVTNTKPVADFSAAPRDACAKTPVKFTDLSTGNVTKWLWDFGDGSTSANQSPQHIYFDTGYFDIQLIVWSSGCPDTIKYPKFIHITPPIARYLVSFNCNRPLERQFTNTSIGADEWDWDFGDGTTSNQKSPLHVFSAPGAYNVSLTVRNHLSGCDFMTIKLIQVVDPVPSFFASDSVICRGSNISFSTNLSLADVKSFAWSFGDGKTSNSSVINTASHLYTAAGDYTVGLVITDIFGCKDTITRPTYIRIDGPVSKFTSSVPGSCLNSLISFNDASASDNVHPIQTWTWNYGDGNTEVLTAAPFQHNYSKPGAYLVSLKVTDSKGCSDSSKLSTALVISKPVAKFTALDTVTCPSKQARFTSQSTGPGLKYLWNFGDGGGSTAKDPVHNYLSDGSYSVKLTVTDLYGCSDSVYQPNIVSIVTPVATFNMSDSFSTCPPLIVQFTNFSTHTISQNWDFGDGTAATVFSPSHFYSYPGIYTVTLTVTGKGGCQDIMKKNIVVNGPKGSFIYDPLIGCKPLKANFVASTADRASFIWDYNDGTTVSTTDSVISHVYTNAGTYLPKMILIDANGCQVPIPGKDSIKVKGITAKLSFTSAVLCDKGTITLTSASTSNDVITSYNWVLGDGSSSTAQNPQHVYSSPGLYYPALTVHTQQGCVDSMRSPSPVKVVASPNISMSASSSGCTPLAATFHASVVVPDTSALSWSWTFGNGSTSTVQNPSVQAFIVEGVYNPSVVATNSSGCKDTAARMIEAYPIPHVNAGVDTTICNKIGIRLQATGATTYSWSPAIGLSCPICANPVATPDSARKYVVKGNSSQGCSATDSVLVKVLYSFKMKHSLPDTLCKGQNLKLFASGTDEYQWTPAASLKNSNSAYPVATPDTTTTYRVIGSDRLGCFRDTAFVPVKVFPIPSVNAGPDQTINVGQSVDLVPVVSADVTAVTWTPTGSIFRNTYPAITVKPNQTTEYTVEGKNGGGCLARDNVTVMVICNGANVFVPNTFSPNGDGANDVFYPRGTGLFKIKTLRIFNRWGEIVFERSSFNANDPAMGWDGTFKGVKSGADVFVYMIDIICDNNSILTYKGNVALIQ